MAGRPAKGPVPTPLEEAGSGPATKAGRPLHHRQYNATLLRNVDRSETLSDILASSCNFKQCTSVSYTHLTLPTILRV